MVLLDRPEALTLPLVKFEVNFEVHTWRKLHFCERPEISIHLANVSRGQQKNGPSGARESSRSTSSATYCATYTDDDVQSVTNATSNESQGDPGREPDFFRESWESHKIPTEPDKKPKPVILETLKIVLGRETYQIAKNLPVADSFLDALT